MTLKNHHININIFYLHSSPVARSKSHFPQHTGGLAGGSSNNRIYQRLLQRWTTQSVSMMLLSEEKSQKTNSACSLRASRVNRIHSNAICVFLSFSRCLVKITGDLTMSFPAGITRIFTANPNVPVLSFRLVNISRIDHFLPNQKLLYRSADLCVLDYSCVFDCVQSLPSCLCVCTVIRLRVTQTPETSGSTCRLCSSTCREKRKLTLRPRTTTLACSNIRSGFKITLHY